MAKNQTSPNYQKGDLLVPLTDPIENQSTISVMDLGRLRFILNDDDGLTALDAAPPVASVFLRPRAGTKEREEFVRIAGRIAAAIDAGPSSGMTHADVISVAARRASGRAFADGVVRTLVGVHTLVASLNKTGTVRLKLSPDARVHERRRSYSASFANELASQSEQLGRLIGHGSTVGTEREELFRALLERHVPRRYHVATGFVDGLDPQFDVLIYDQVDYAPLLRAGNLVVVPPEAVRAVIEIKSTLNSTSLPDALDHLSSAFCISGEGPPIFRGIFAYSGIGARPIAKAIRQFHRPFENDTPIDDDDLEPVTHVGQMVDAVCVLGEAMVRTTFAKMPDGFEFPWMPATVSMESHAGHSSQGGAFFDLLDRYLRHPYVGPFGRSSLMDIVRDDMLSAEVIPLYKNEDWATPFIMMDGGEEFGDRIQAFLDWLAGAAWRSEMAES